MGNDMFIKGQLAALAIQEGARHGGVENMVAVARVMYNRVQSGWQGGDWMRVLENSPGMAGTIYPPQSVDLRDLAVRMFLQRIDDIFTGAEEDETTNGALFYCELHQVDREWFKENVLKRPAQHRRVAQIGPVTFLR